jgi:hypothetical protein
MANIKLGRKLLANGLAAALLGIALVAYAPSSGDATVLGNIWTTGYTGGGFTAVTTGTRSAELRVESDWSSGSNSGWAGDYAYNSTYLSIDAWANPCVGTFNVYTQHSAYDPSNSEYEWASTGGNGNCSGSPGWDPEGEHCSRNQMLHETVGYPLDPACGN